MSDVLDLADRFIRAVEAGDLETVRAIYAPDAVIWHNHDRKETTVEENLRVLAWMANKVTGKSYEDIRRQETDTGYVQQHVLKGTAPNGRSFEVAACLVVEVRSGRIVRLDEYLDSGAIEPLLA
jgi:ketosteroid isomerase-like protein